MEKPGGAAFSTSPNCEHNPRMVRVQFETSQSTGLYYMTVTARDNYDTNSSGSNMVPKNIPHEWWEVSKDIYLLNHFIVLRGQLMR